MKAGCLKASNRRPPPIDPDKPIPDAAFGPYVFHKYHANALEAAMKASQTMPQFEEPRTSASRRGAPPRC